MMRTFGCFILSIIIFVNPLYSQITGLSGWNIFLDPGHSRTENMGIYGYSEAERNLRVALRLKEMLLNWTDIDTVYLSRTNDQQVVSLSQRTDKANNLGADWFHSIHSDAGPPQYNSTLLLWGQKYNGQEKVPNGGKAMSDIMVDILTRGMRTTTRGSIGDCSFYTWSDWCERSGGPYLHVNRVTTMASELSESGFHTNPRQNQLFMNADWKKLEAKTFYWSILKYHGIERPFAGTCLGIVSDLETDQPINGAEVTLDERTYVTDTYVSLFYKYSDDPDQLHNGFYYFDGLPDDTLQMIVDAEDYYGDTLQVTILDTFFTFQDVKLLSKVPPHVVSTVPEQDAQKHPAWEDIIFEFSRTMDRASVETTLVTIPELPGRIRWRDDDTRMIFRPDSMDFETTYTITISGEAKDDYGHPFDGNSDGVGGDEFSLNFKTGPADMFPPELQTSYPAGNSREVELMPLINFTFDEPLDTMSIDENIIQINKYGEQETVPGLLEHFLIREHSVLCFFLEQQLASSQTYIARLNAGLSDVHGNEITRARAFRFTTGDTYYDTQLIDDYEGDIYWWQPQQSGSTTGILTNSTGTSVNSQIINHLTESSRSLQVDYGWQEGAGSFLIRVHLPINSQTDFTFDKNNTMQVYVFGDGSGVKFRFAVDDRYPNLSAGNHEVSPWYIVDWYGWKLVEWDMSNDETGTWLGDGSLDGDLRFDSIQLSHTEGDPTTGTLYFDDLRIADEVVVDVSSPDIALPDHFALYQNYPNPFNPVTTIRFALPRRTNVRLKIIDLMGNEVMTLAQGRYEAGVHSAVLNASELASGIYFYRLETESFKQTKKLMLVK